MKTNKVMKEKKKINKRGAVIKNKKGEKNYTIENVQSALNAMGEGLTLRQAASRFRFLVFRK